MSILGEEVSVPAAENASKVIGWVKEAVQEGESFLRKQVGYAKIGQTINMIMGEDRGDLRGDGLSNIVDNEFGNIALQLASALTDVRQFWEYKTANRNFERQADILNKLAGHWWSNRQIDQRFLDASKFSLAGGSGYMHTLWDPIIQDFTSYAEHPHDVLPVRVNGYDSIQNCFAVVVRREKTVNELRARWPNKNIQATRDGSVATEDEQNMASRIISRLNQSNFSRYREFLSKAVANYAGGVIPVTDLFTCYVKDRTRNTTGQTILMGPWSGDGKTPLMNWSYRVAPGGLLYPRGRVIVCTPLTDLYDGPNPYWHGQFPISKLTLDGWPYPNAFLGKSPLWDIMDHQRSLNRSERAIEDYVEKIVGPDTMFDQGAVSQASIDTYDSRKARNKFKRRPGPGAGITPIPLPQLPPEVLQKPEFHIGRMQALSGVTDVSAVMKLQQLPSAEAMERIMEQSTGPVRARSRALEAFMREFAMQRAYDFTQYYSVAQRIAIAGADGVTVEDFDYDPDSLVPSHMGSDYDREGNLRPEMQNQSRPREDRAREFLRYFTYHVSPGSLLKGAKITEQMMYLQLFRAGVMDPWTLMEKLEIPNVGTPPGRTITERLQGAATMGLQGQVSAAGRKSSGQQPPKMKSSGAVSESG